MPRFEFIWKADDRYRIFDNETGSWVSFGVDSDSPRKVDFYDFDEAYSAFVELNKRDPEFV